jgi:hypothetical protein
MAVQAWQYSMAVQAWPSEGQQTVEPQMPAKQHSAFASACAGASRTFEAKSPLNLPSARAVARPPPASLGGSGTQPEVVPAQPSPNHIAKGTRQLSDSMFRRECMKRTSGPTQEPK